MPGDPKDSTPNSALPARQQNAADTTSGEFTQIFASGSAVRPAQAGPELSGVSEDEFAKLFQLPAAPAAVPSAPSQEAAANEATLIFQALPPVSPPPGAFTEPKTTTGPPAEPRPTTASRAASTSGDFTQVFSPVAPPTVAAPAERPKATSTPSSAGEFTQFFSAISARESLLTAQPQSVEAVAPNRPAAYTETAGPVPARYQAEGTTRQAEMPSSQPGSMRQPARPFDSASSESTPSSTASAVTQVFYQEPAVAEPARGRAPAAPAPPGAAQGESFTQIFQQIAPPPQGGRVAGPSKVPLPPQPPASPTPAQNGWPAFGPAQPTSGAFTDVFAAQPQQSSPPAAPWPAPSGPSASQGSGFTELFQAMPTSPARVDASPFGVPAASAPGGAGWPAAPQDAPLNVAGGDFTRLMQSLTPGTQQSAHSASLDEAFFAPVQVTGRSQESEFTRIQQASLRRESGATAPAPAVAAPSLAAPNEKAAEKQAPAGKSKLLILLLVAMNVLLLIALIVIGYIALKHK